MHNERTCGEINFSISVSLDNVDADPQEIVADLQRTFSRAISANERFLPRGVELEELWADYIDLYVKNDDDRREDYLMATDPRV